MTDQEKKDSPQKAENQAENKTEQQEDILALDTDIEMEDLVDSIAEKERSMKTGKKG